MSHRDLYLRLVDDVIKASARADLPNAEVRRKALLSFLDRDSNDGRDTIEVPRGDMGDSIDATFASLSFEEDSLDEL